MSLDIWAVWPTVNILRSRNMIGVWQAHGCRVAILVNKPHEHDELPEADRIIVQDEWRGFPVAANILCREVPGDIVVVVGDDVYPDLRRTAQEIGEEFQQRFPDLFGVMQPIGDQYGLTHKCAVSPWIGRPFIERVYGGQGPYWPGYFHYYSDHELQLVAEKLGVFQQREDLTQFHDHWQRKEGRPRRPQYLQRAKRLHRKDQALWVQRSKAGYPGL